MTVPDTENHTVLRVWKSDLHAQWTFEGAANKNFLVVCDGVSPVTEKRAGATAPIRVVPQKHQAFVPKLGQGPFLF